MVVVKNTNLRTRIILAEDVAFEKKSLAELTLRVYKGFYSSRTETIL